MSLNGGEWASMSLRALIPFTLNEDPMKPRKGFTLVAGKEKLGEGKTRRAIAGFHKMCYFEGRKFPIELRRQDSRKGVESRCKELEYGRHCFLNAVTAAPYRC